MSNTVKVGIHPEAKPCAVCGAPEVQWHHENYDTNEGEWLCPLHHSHRQKQLRRSGANLHRLLSPKEVARTLSFKPRTITRWCREGQFPTAKKRGRVWRIPEKDPFLQNLVRLQGFENDSR